MSKTLKHALSSPRLSDDDIHRLIDLLISGASLADSREELLEALRELRWQRKELALEQDRRHAVGTHRVIIQGFSAESEEKAFSNGLEKASHYFSEHHDISITLMSLTALQKGGYRAVLEVHVTPMTLRDTAHREAADVELKRIQERDYRMRQRRAEHALEHHVQDHFLTTTGMAPQVPDFFLINLHDAELLNHMIEKEFMRAGHNLPHPVEFSEPVLAVRVRKPAPDGTQEYSVTLTGKGESHA